MSRATVIELARLRIQSRHKKRAQRLNRRHARHVAIHSTDNRFRIAANSRVRANQTDEMCDPHPRGESLATDVAQREHESVRRLFDTEKISRQMSNCKNLARNFESAMAHKTRRTQSPVHLCSLEDRSVELRVI